MSIKKRKMKGIRDTDDPTLFFQSYLNVNVTGGFEWVC